MGKDTKIEWANHTFNHIRGCSRVSEGCRFCYAETLSHRNPTVLGIWGNMGTRVVASESAWREPLKWDKAATKRGVRERVFCASLADVFEDWRGSVVDSGGNVMWYKNGRIVSAGATTPGLVYGERPATMDDVRERLFRLIVDTPNLDWLLLTKRPENALCMMVKAGLYAVENPSLPCPQKNLWVGASVENQDAADERIPHLLRIPAIVRFLSCEPLLGPVDLRPWLRCPECHGKTWDRIDVHAVPCPVCDGDYHGIDQVIAGGESGPEARPSHLEWFRKVRDDCVASNIAYFFKQWGTWVADGQAMPCPVDAIGGRGSHVSRALFLDGTHLPDLTGRGTNGDGAIVVRKVGKKNAGRLLDGREWSEFPEVSHA